MSKNIYLDLEDGLSEAVQKIKESDQKEISLAIPQNSIFWQNRISLKLLLKECQEAGKEVTIVSSNNLGIKLAKEVGFKALENLQQVQAFTNKEKEVEMESKTDELGFVEGKDIAEVLSEKKSEEEKPAEVKFDQGSFSLKNGKVEKKENPANLSSESVFSLDDKKGKRFYQRLIRKPLFWIGLVSIFLILGLSGFMLWYLPDAEVIVYVQGQSLEKRLELEAKTSVLEPNIEDGLIPAVVIEVEEKGEKTADSTGTKMVGEKATGTVSLQNWTDEEKTFKTGTLLTVAIGETGEGLTFITDSDAIIPAQTFSVPEEGQKLYEAGQVSVSVTASAVGKDYNLAEKTNFLVGDEDFSQLKGINNQAFEGGSSKEVTIVSESDRQNILEDLSSELFKKGEEDIKSKIVGDQKYDQASINNQVIKSSFDAKAGEEKKNLTLSLSTKSQVSVFSESQVKKIISYYLEESAPEGFKLELENITLKIESVKAKDQDLEISVLGKASILPEINTDKLKSKLLNIRPWEAEELLRAEDKVVGHKIELWPPLPRFLLFMPHFKERLKIEVLENHGNSGD